MGPNDTARVRPSNVPTAVMTMADPAGDCAIPDDTRFDLRHHGSARRPARRRELAELVEQVHRGPLDRWRPLWKLYLVQGSPRGGWPG